MKKKRFISMLICIAMVVTMAPCIVSAADGVAINATNFPDANFMNYVSNTFDTNSDGFLSETEIANITSIDVTDMSISTLEGIGYFTAITTLYCSNNNLTTLDVSNNTALQVLYCYDNNLTTLDVSNNSALEILSCSGNNISTLDISCVPELLRVVNEGSESVFTYNGYEVRQFIDDESGLACDLSTTIVTNPPVTEEPTSTVAPVRPSVDRTQAELFVTRCYEEALNRTPDSEGLANWTNSLVDRSLSGTQLAYGIIFSPEFQNRNLSNEDFVECLYQMFLDRPSDPAGKADWVSQLNNGASREVIFAGFVNSVEYFNLCRTYGLNAGYYMVGVDMNRQGAVNGFVDRLYGYCLGRSGDQGGQQNWVTQLINGSATGAQVAYGFFFSPEFMNNNYSNEVFVTILYNVCLNRAPDPDGLNNWVTALDNGADRLEVFRGFAHSDEFTGICNNYGIVRGSI